MADRFYLERLISATLLAGGLTTCAAGPERIDLCVYKSGQVPRAASPVSIQGELILDLRHGPVLKGQGCETGVHYNWDDALAFQKEAIQAKCMGVDGKHLSGCWPSGTFIVDVVGVISAHEEDPNQTVFFPTKVVASEEVEEK